MPQNAVIIDAATRFLRSNPELVDFARRGAVESGQRVDDLIADAICRIRRSEFEAVSQEEVIVGPPYRLDRGPEQRIRRGGKPVDDSRPRLVVVASREPRRDGQEQLVHHVIRKQAAEQ
jgi:hypothetical protein